MKDKTSELIGGRQASTFLTLAALAGHGEPVRPAASKPVSAPKPKARRVGGSAAAGKQESSGSAEAASTPATPRYVPGADSPVGLTVRVEVNLPSAATAEVYDAIFASIRKNLIDRA